MRRATWRLPGRWLVPVVCVPLALMLWLGYRATAEWQRSATRLATQRAETAAALLETALSRDMRAVQATLLSSSRLDHVVTAETDLVDMIASAFARYPYPEAFYAWSDTASTRGVVFYGRSDRYPGWMTRDDDADVFPVALGKDSTTGDRLMQRVARDARFGRRYALFDIEIDGSTYQVVSFLDYHDSFRERLRAVFGFIVNLTWARAHYFRDLTTQVAGMPEVDGIALSILDAAGRSIVGMPNRSGGLVAQRRVELVFFDPRLVAVRWPADLARDVWTIEAVVSVDPTLRAAHLGARRTLTISGVSAVVLAVGVVLAVQAARAKARLSELRSEFVSSVTHELKTPLASIQAIGQTFVSDRGITPELSRKYGLVTLHEAKRLRRQIDNLLAYARITDISNFYSFDRLPPSRVVEATLRDFASQLEYAKFEMAVDVPAALPDVRADERAMKLVLSNLIDNAIRYSSGSRYMGIRGFHDGDAVVIEVTDHGSGIPHADLPHVTGRFFRGLLAEGSGSGLGLAIVERMITDHGGSLRVRSTVDVGTTVSVTFPVAEDGVKSAAR